MWPLRVKVREYVYYPRKPKAQEQNEKQRNQQHGDVGQQTLPTQQVQQQSTQVSSIETNNMFGALANVDSEKQPQ